MDNNTYDFDLYKKMQHNRSSYYTREKWKNKFKNLIESIKKK